MVSVVVIGGGVAGCSVGHFLTEAGHDVQILEADELGGMLREIEFSDGSHCDSAPHVLFFDEADAPARELFETHTRLDSFEPYAKTYPTGTLGEPHDYPVSRRNTELWEDGDTLRAQLDAADGDHSPGDTFDEFVTAQVGPEMYRRYFASYTATQWGVDPSEIVGDWFDYKIDFVAGEEPFFGETDAFYPRRKYADVVADVAAGCDVVHDRATGLATADGRVTAVETAGGELAADVVVNTVDPAHLLPTDPPYRYRSMVVVGVRATLSDSLFPEHVSWGYFPNDYRFTRVTDYEFTPWSFGDQTLLTVEFPCFTDDDLWRRSDEWFRDRVADFLREQGIDGRIDEIVTRRLPRAYPLPVERDRTAFRRANDRIARYENCYNLGRIATYEYIWVRDIVDAAATTAERIDTDAETSSPVR